MIIWDRREKMSEMIWIIGTVIAAAAGATAVVMYVEVNKAMDRDTRAERTGVDDRLS
jgi:hypothetical protein